ncbi:Sporulation-specific extracellular nuclease precursor [compost metagenome]
MSHYKIIISLVMVTLLSSCTSQTKYLTTKEISSSDYDYTIEFPVSRYPETADHIKKAIEAGESAICTIDRNGAEENRDQSLQGISTKKGYDRDEWPMAMCAEGGQGADIQYVTPKDNRGAGSWVGNKLENYPNGTRVLFIVDGVTNKNKVEITEKPEQNDNIIYKNCTDVRNRGKSPLLEGQSGYSLKLDKDGDGIACE